MREGTMSEHEEQPELSAQWKAIARKLARNMDHELTHEELLAVIEKQAAAVVEWMKASGELSMAMNDHIAAQYECITQLEARIAKLEAALETA
jgi:hypothetical protein